MAQASLLLVARVTCCGLLLRLGRVPQGLGEGDEVDWFGFFGGIIERIGSLLLH